MMADLQDVSIEGPIGVLRKKSDESASRVIVKKKPARRAAIETFRWATGINRPSATPPANIAARQTAGSFTCAALNEQGFRCDVFAGTDQTVRRKQGRNAAHSVSHQWACARSGVTRQDHVRASKDRRTNRQSRAPALRRVLPRL